MSPKVERMDGNCWPLVSLRGESTRSGGSSPLAEAAIVGGDRVMGRESAVG